MGQFTAALSKGGTRTRGAGGGGGGGGRATGTGGAGFCDACFTGNYPVAVPVTLRKHVLEEPPVPRPGSPVQTVID